MFGWEVVYPSVRMCLRVDGNVDYDQVIRVIWTVRQKSDCYLERRGSISMSQTEYTPSTEHVLDQRRHKKRLFMQLLFDLSCSTELMALSSIRHTVGTTKSFEMSVIYIMHSLIPSD